MASTITTRPPRALRIIIRVFLEEKGLANDGWMD
jgi:hypothetical protein